MSSALVIRPRRVSGFRLFLCGILAGLLSGCGTDPTPEDAVRAWLADVVEAAEARDVGALRTLIAADYSDGRGNDKPALVNYCRGLILQHQTLRVFAEFERIELLSPVWAKLRVRAAIAGKEVDQAWWEASADLYRLDLELIETDGRWELVRADWAPAHDR